MSIVGYYLWICLTQQQCHQVNTNQGTYIESEKVCAQMVDMLWEKLGRSAYCVPILRED